VTRTKVANEYRLSIRISTRPPPPATEATLGDAFVTMVLPGNVATPGCEGAHCSSNDYGGSRFVHLSFRMERLSIGGIAMGGRGTANVLLKADEFVFAGNGVNLEGQLPAVTTTVDVLKGSVPVQQPIRQTPQVVFQYEMPELSSLDWIGGPVPARGIPDPINRTSAAVLTWTEDSSAAGQPVLVSAVDRVAEAADSRAVFFAGVLAGIAGSAFIGALQELLHVHPQHAGRRRHPHV
jgi:hypothetical protein